MLQPRILEVEPLSDYKLKLIFETKEEKIFDVSPYISGSWYERLKDPGYFKTVHITDGGKGIEWAEGQDIAPHELYDASVLTP
ncbi:conserved hypothetical protein [Treponema primitia ZAS-2]|uniref:DUF2442 domain-containing protein n=1 Tax=Treponema primitia (strain ATCC BAA-887 / DSM 12427 / ZAS-2) TaxID=545694 RepID=F5YQZ3_TREPZ|nr:DUF2442 domain-containing protein [Treponema primitia]AEF86568.1 conserved hypothetical protein [Treponema primitia ZAS-2]